MSRLVKATCEPIDQGTIVDCTCGYRGGLYAHPVGARTAYLQHLVGEVANGVALWPGVAEVEYREDDE